MLSIPLLLPDGNVFPARYELVFLAAGVILFSLFVGVVMLPILLQHIEVADHSQQLKEERIARAATAEVAIVAIQKMEERLAADTEENIDNQLLTEVSSRVIGNLRRRADGRNDVESSVQEENLERRFRLAALRSERAELYHLRASAALLLLEQASFRRQLLLAREEVRSFSTHALILERMRQAMMISGCLRSI